MILRGKFKGFDKDSIRKSLRRFLDNEGYGAGGPEEVSKAYITGGLDGAVNAIAYWNDSRCNYTEELRGYILKWEIQYFGKHLNHKPRKPRTPSKPKRSTEDKRSIQL